MCIRLITNRVEIVQNWLVGMSSRQDISHTQKKKISHAYILGMGRFTGSHRCTGIKAHDAMARIKKVCTGYNVG